MGFFSKPKKPTATAEEKAIGIRQRTLLDKEIEEQEARFKNIARGKLGRSSLLTGAPRTPAEAASGSRRAASGGSGSLLSSGSSASGPVSSSGAKVGFKGSGGGTFTR